VATPAENLVLKLPPICTHLRDGDSQLPEIIPATVRLLQYFRHRNGTPTHKNETDHSFLVPAPVFPRCAELSHILSQKLEESKSGSISEPTLYLLETIIEGLSPSPGRDRHRGNFCRSAPGHNLGFTSHKPVKKFFTTS
jgi:hypothetical protein